MWSLLISESWSLTGSADNTGRGYKASIYPVHIVHLNILLSKPRFFTVVSF